MTVYVYVVEREIVEVFANEADATARITAYANAISGTTEKAYGQIRVYRNHTLRATITPKTVKG